MTHATSASDGLPGPDGEVVVLGVDPGLRITGYGVLRCSPHRTDAVDYNHIKTDSSAAVEARLQAVYWGIREVLQRFEVHELAIEMQFMAVNVRSAFAVGEARAAALLAAAEEGVPVFQYTPAEVKSSVTGYGRSEKQQVQKNVRMQLGLVDVPPPDEADALAVALCHYANRRMRGLTARY
ncbi:MAG: crossover junction endodeoxyribonuclease RuvC [Dehalococcoidia bacterium]